MDNTDKLEQSLKELRELINDIRARVANTERKINFIMTRETPWTDNVVPDTGLQRWGNRTFAQHGDDIIALAILETMGISKPTYLDVGAHHPFNISNTALMYIMGCRGINIEPNPVLFDLFPVQRPQDVNLNFGISDTKGMMKFFIFNELSGLNTFDPDRAAFVERSGLAKLIKTIDVEVTTLEDVVIRHSAGVFPDFFSLDVEGLDYKILETIDFKKHRPAVICVETNSSAEANMINDLLVGANYSFVIKSIVNLFYADSDRYDSKKIRLSYD